MQEKVLHFLPENQLRGQHQRDIEKQELALSPLYRILYLHKVPEIGSNNVVERLSNISRRKSKCAQGWIQVDIWLIYPKELQWAHGTDSGLELAAILKVSILPVYAHGLRFWRSFGPNGCPIGGQLRLDHTLLRGKPREAANDDKNTG